MLEVTIVETRRLKLRELRPDDLDELAVLLADEEQMRFFPRVRSREEASGWLERSLAVYAGHGFGFWAIESRREHAFLGYRGIRPFALDGVAETEMGWHTAKASWGRGVATEAALAARDLAFGRFGLSRLVAYIHAGNIASRRVAERIGMRKETTATFDDHPGATYVVYALERERACCPGVRRSTSSPGGAAPQARYTEPALALVAELVDAQG